MKLQTAASAVSCGLISPQYVEVIYRNWKNPRQKIPTITVSP